MSEAGQPRIDPETRGSGRAVNAPPPTTDPEEGRAVAGGPAALGMANIMTRLVLVDLAFFSPPLCAAASCLLLAAHHAHHVHNCMADVFHHYPRTMSSSYSPTQPQIYPPALPHVQPTSSSSPEGDDGDATPPKSADAQKLETKPQATFLTKLYAYVALQAVCFALTSCQAARTTRVPLDDQMGCRRRADHRRAPRTARAARPAQHLSPVTLCLLFASAQREYTPFVVGTALAQIPTQIYGFMRKVNLRNVDPAIDDPDASTWCTLLFVYPSSRADLFTAHPTLNRNSPPEVVANFKRRVPPRLPKPRKRDQLDMSRVGPGSLAPGLTVPSSTHMALGMNQQGKPRARGFSTPSLPFGFAGTAHLQPAGQPQPYYHNVAPPQKWGGGASYGNSLPPLTVPGEHGYSGGYRHLDDPHAPYGHSSQYGPSHHSGQQLPVLRDSTAFQYPGYGTGAPGSGADTSSWSFLPPASSLASGHSGSLSSLLNHPSANSSSYGRPPSSGGGFGHGSPDSRPNTGYSVASSVSSIGGGYDGGEQNPFALRPTAGGRDDSGRPLTPTSASGVRPGSSKGQGASSLSVRNGRPRRHSQVSPYPSPYSPYDSEAGSRPGTAPDDHLGPQRSRSMAEPYGSFQGGPAPAEFAYSASGAGVDNGEWLGQRGVRPSTSTSTMSGHSPASNSALNTPPGIDDGGIATTPPASGHGASGPFGASEADMSRCE